MARPTRSSYTAHRALALGAVAPRPRYRPPASPRCSLHAQRAAAYALALLAAAWAVGALLH